MSGIDEQATARRCVFCGAEADSREHVLPDWLQDVLPSREPVVYSKQVGSNPANRREWLRRPFREKTRFVCESCNTRWMSDLEKTAKPLLVPPITRVPVTYGRRAQTILATWAAKTCLVLHASQGPAHIAPPATYAYLRAHGEPPPQLSVWLASHYRAKEDPVNSVFIQRPLFLQPLDDKLAPQADFGFLCFLAVGGVSFVVVGHRYRSRTEITYEGSFDETLIQIWPRPAAVVSWPPKYMMDREFIDILTESPSALTVKVWPTAE